MNQLLLQGLAMTGLGMGLVFLGLALIWGLIVLMRRLFPVREFTAPTASPPAMAAPRQGEAQPAAVDALTAERARVAVIVAGAFLANALPLKAEVPSGPNFEHGRTAPCWVTANRARVLQSWQPQRRGEG